MEDPEQRVQGAGLRGPRRLVVEHEAPDDRRGDGADGHRQEDRDLRDGLVAHAVEDDRDDQAQEDAEEGVEDQPQHAVLQRRQRVGEREEVLVVREADPVGVGVVAEADEERAEQWIDHEDGREPDRGKGPEVGPDPGLQALGQALDDPLAQDDVAQQHERHADHRSYRCDDLS